MQYANTYAKIDLDIILENYRAICRLTGPTMAIIKADAYGHGAVAVAKTLEPECPFFGVSSVAEAMELRAAGITKPILNLGHTPVCTYPEVVELGIRPAIFCLEDAQALSAEAVKQGKIANFHFVVDTGMSRIGFQVTEESADICQKIASLPNLHPEGLFSHYATADCLDLTKANAQREKYCAFADMLRARGVEVEIRHLNNSAGLMNFSGQFNMARAGIILYGLYPSDEVDPQLLTVRPALSWHSRVSHVKTLEAGRDIGYGATFTTEKPTRVATVAAGYADGYRRCLSNRFYVLIRGRRAPILGRVCMDQFMVDVTEIPEVTPGDVVTLLGTDGDETISAETIAAAAGSFNYEQVCDLNRRVARVYIRNGKEVSSVNYLLNK